jgi:hypothetical protein
MIARFHLVSALLLLALPHLGAGELPLMQNLDGDLSFVGATPQASKEKLQKLIDDIAAGPAKTLMWSIGAGSDILYYQTKVASTWGWRPTKYDGTPEWGQRIKRCREATEAGLDAPRIVGERARERGLKFVPSYRMNDAHYCSDPLNYPLTGRFWMEHQNAALGVSPVAGWDGYKDLLDYAREDVRAYRLGVILEAMDRYADLMDGFELDFNRFQVFFKPGTASQNAPLITAMVGQARERLDAIAAAQKRPMKLFVRVPPAIKNCTWAGLEVETWMKQHLVEAVIPAQVMTLSHDMPLEEFVQIAKPAGCEVIGSLYGRSGSTWPFSAEHRTESYASEVSRTPTAPQFLGAALNQEYQGVSAHQIYNFILHSNAEVVKALTTQKGIRRFHVTQAYFHDREDNYEYRKQMPAPLLPGEATNLRLLIGQSVTPGTAYLRLGLHGANQSYSDVSMTALINGHTLHTGPTAQHLVVTTGTRHGIAPCPATEAYVQWPITDAAMLREGWNDIAVTLLATSQKKSLQLVETEIAITQP